MNRCRLREDFLGSLGPVRVRRVLLCVLLLNLSGCAGAYADGSYLYGEPTRSATEMPEFAWPPPRYTGAVALPDGLLVEQAARLGDVHQAIGRRLVRAGLEGATFRLSHDGFVVATDVRCIETNGALSSKQGPSCLKPNRKLASGFSFGDYWRALLGASPGHYRMFIIVVTPKVVAPDVQAVTMEQALDVWGQGSTHLPREMAASRLVEGTRVTAVVYEFERTGASEKEAHVVLQSAISTREHLLKAGLFRSEDL